MISRTPLHAFLAAAALMILLSATASAAEPVIDAKYPGGNIIIEKIAGDTVFIAPDLRDTRGWWFYWNFRVRQAAGRTLTFRFTGQNPIGVRGPAVSRDGGLSWNWMGARAVAALESKPPAWEFSYTFDRDQEIRFSFCIPYLQSDLERFLERYKDNPALKLGELCKSRKGRGVEMLRLGKMEGEPKWRLLLTARHHCCESMADYAMEGFLESILAPTAEGRAWRERVAVMAIPFMDKDGVEDGDQGKNRAPRDHNRDYDGESVHPEVAALRRLAPEWSAGKPMVTLDLHCPHIRGANNEHIYFVGSSRPAVWEETKKLSAILEATRTGPLPYEAKGNVPYGTAWNTATNTRDGMSCGQFFGGLPGVRLASSIEIPYATVQGKEMTAEAARALGKDLARALFKYLGE